MSSSDETTRPTRDDEPAPQADTGGPAAPHRVAAKAPASQTAGKLAEQLLAEEDLRFVQAIRDAGLALDLSGEELLRVAALVGDGSALQRRIDLLEAYYAAAGDAKLAATRRTVDRFLLQRATDRVTAGGLVHKLAELAPELGPIKLERIGGDADGPLVLRAGEHFAALLDDYEETLDTDEIDLREIEERRRSGRAPMVTMRGLVRAVNVLLDRNGVRERMVALRSDEAREVYIATGATEAFELARGGYLEDEDVEDVMDLTGW